MIGRTLGRYRIDRRLGEGGMGVVYAGRDLDLERDVAIKVVRRDVVDTSLRERFRREARAAAQINHPNIGHLYEIGEVEGETYIAMELLEGETLADRLARGPLPPAEATRLGLELLAALAALHGRGFVHRDVKPSNVFLLADGRVKLLDFGLVLPVGEEARARGASITMTGMVMGSPRYMAPEQIRGDKVDARADLFSLAALLHETLTGHPVFSGSDPVSVMYAVTNARAPDITGSAELAALGTILGRALAKHPDQRPASAEEMAAQLRSVREITPSSGRFGGAVERIVRLAVVPFRMLRPDPDLDFLGPSLADAIAMSLAGIRSLVVRSPMAAARFANASPDLGELARALDCDVVLFGTVLPAGKRCRVAAQLVEVPGGEVLWSQTSEASGGDVFEIQDLLVKRIVESLQLPLSGRERNALGSDVPANPIAYEFFLRANRSGMIGNQVVLARELYRRSVEADPNFAPAWVRLARCHRVIGKYDLSADSDAEFARCKQALDRALALHPDMPSAHHMGALFALDSARVGEALDRLIQVVGRNPNDPQGWSGLVAAFRYAGMLEESSAAYARCQALEPGMVTSYFHTLDALGRYEEALSLPSTSFEFDQVRVLAILGRTEESLQLAATLRAREQGTALESWVEVMEAAVLRDAAKARRVGPSMESFRDPEGRAVVARCRIEAGDVEGGLAMFVNAVRQGYSNAPLFHRDPWFDAVRDRAEFREAVALAEERQRGWIAAYRGRIAALAAPAPAAAT